MKRFLSGAVLVACVLFAMPQPVRAYDVEACCEHASGLHQRICCDIAELIDWWDMP